MKVTNRVFCGTLMEAPNWEALIRECEQLGLDYKAHKCRPFMFRVRVKNGGGTFLFFRTAKFRVMGARNKTSVHQLLHSMFHLSARSLHLQTRTVTFKVPPLKELHFDFVKRFDSEIWYEPELFPAIKLLRWPEVHVNLFFTGAVVVLGKKAKRCAPKVKTWLDSLFAESAHMN